MRSRDYRVALAAKWYFVDQLPVAEVRDKFEEEYGLDLTGRAVYNYLEEEEAEKVKEQIKEKHAETRLQVVDREEQAHQQARREEARVVNRVEVKRVVPQADQVSTKREDELEWQA